MLLRSLRVLVVLCCLASLPDVLLSTPSWSGQSPFANPGNLGAGSITSISNPAEPPCDEGGFDNDTSPGVSKPVFDVETGDVLLSYEFAGSPYASYYEIQFVDSNQYAKDDEWKAVGEQKIYTLQNSHTDGSYGVNASRYYRIVGFSQNDEIVYRHPKIEHILRWQRYDGVGYLYEEWNELVVRNSFRNYVKTEMPSSFVSDWSAGRYTADYNYYKRHDYIDYEESYRSSGKPSRMAFYVTRYVERYGFSVDEDGPNYVYHFTDSRSVLYLDSGRIGVHQNQIPPMDLDPNDGGYWGRYHRSTTDQLWLKTILSNNGLEMDCIEPIYVRRNENGEWNSFNVNFLSTNYPNLYNRTLVVEWGGGHVHVQEDFMYDGEYHEGSSSGNSLIFDLSKSERLRGNLKFTPYSVPSGNKTFLTFKILLDNGIIAYEEKHDIIFLDDDENTSGSPDYYSIPFNDATGPKYRKIGLNGRPLPDERPQDAVENDEAKEETYIDAFNLNLVHSTTDIYVPIHGSELALSLRRNVSGEVFNENSGLRPGEDPAKPFGAGWSSNVASYIRVITPDGPDIEKYEEPVRAYVTDENGQTYSFVKYGDGWFPLPSASHEAKAFTTSLEEGENYFLFRQKHGNALRYEKLSTTQELMRERVEGSRNKEIYSYARLLHVTDRMGYQLVYTYATGSQGLIPQKIQAHRLGTESTVGTPIPGLQIWLRQQNNRVVFAWDPNGNAIEYSYNSISYNAYSVAAQARIPQQASVLEAVTYADGTTTGYTYEHVTEGDYVPRNPDDLDRPGPYPDPLVIDPCDALQQHIDYEHINLASITNGNGRTFTFVYDFDHSRESFVSNPVTEDYYIQTGAPRYIKKVILPIGESNFTLGNNEEGNRMRITATGQNYEGLAITGNKVNSVIDAEGFTTTYTFEGIQIEVLKQFSQLHFAGESRTRYKDPRILYYTTMRVGHGSYGEEVYTFTPEAGLALASATDLSGNIRTYVYSDAANQIVVPAPLSNVWPILYSYYNDPIREEQFVTSLGLLSKDFTYDTRYRKMTSYRDPRGNIIETILDAMGRSQRVTVYEGNRSAIASRTTYAYSAAWPGFVTQESIERLASDPSWAMDIVVDYAPDSQGRITSQTSYPTINADGGTVSPLITNKLYDFNGNLRLTTDPNGHATGFDYDARNRLTKSTFADNSYIAYSYDKVGNRVLERNENGNLTGHEYNALSRRVKTVQSLDGTLAYNPVSRKLTGISAGDPLVESEYNLVGSLIMTSVADGPLTRYGYDGLQRIVVQRQLASENPGVSTDIVSTFVYGTNSGGSVFNTSGFRPTLSVGPRGYQTIVAYDERYQPISSGVEYATGQFATTLTAYDANGNVVSATDPRGNTTQTLYDAQNRPVQITFADNTNNQIAYTGTGLQWKVVDALGNEAITQYDGAARPIVQMQPSVGYIGESGGWQLGGKPTTGTYYDAAGNVVAIKNPRGEIWSYTYDVRNRRTHEQQPAVTVLNETGELSNGSTPTIVTEYDFVGNVIGITDPRGYRSATEYDAANRPVYNFTPIISYLDSVVASAHLVTRSAYNRAGGILEIWQGHSASQSASGATLIRRNALNAYDALGRLMATTDGMGITVANGYDASGNLIQVTDGKGQVTTLSYDGLNRNLTTSYGNVDTTTLAYDSMVLTARLDPNGHTTSYAYDNRNRLQAVSYAGAPEENRTYIYDANGNVLAVTENKATDTSVTYSYDALNRVSEETSAGIAHRYRYDLAGNRRETIYDVSGNAPRTLTSTYDALNRTATITEGGRTTTYRYDLSGNIRETLQPNGDSIRRSYDSLGRQSVIVGPGSIGNELYLTTNTYDTFGNLKRIAESYPAGNLTGRTILNDYDSANRLYTETITWADAGAAETQTSYRYDTANNRISRTVTVGGALDSDITYSYNGLNQLLSATDSISNSHAAYTYDRNGNRITTQSGITGSAAAGKSVRYSYDRENRLVELVKGTVEPQKINVFPGLNDRMYPQLAVQATYYKVTDGDTYRYAYDYRTRRVLRDESAAGGTTANLVFSGGTYVREYQNASPAPAAEFIRGSDYSGGIGGLLYSLRGNTPSFKHYNSRGDVVAATDDNSSLTYQAAYEAFGRHGDTASSEEWGTNPDRQQANTKDQDPTGLLNEGFRYRDLETGTFITRDPLGFVDGPNVYTYVVQNPWTKFDPLGLKKAKVSLKENRRALAEAMDNADPQSDGEAMRKAEKGFDAAEALQKTTVNTLEGLASLTPHGTAMELLTGKSPGGTRELSGEDRMLAGAGVFLPMLKGVKFADEAVDGVSALKNAGRNSEIIAKGIDKAGDVPLLTTSGGYNPWVGEIRSIVAESDVLMWRVHGDGAAQIGGWLSPTRPNSTVGAIRDLALPAQNSAEWLSPVRVPAGTRYQTGTAAGAFGQPGGGAQVLLLDAIPATNFGTPQPLAPWRK